MTEQQTKDQIVARCWTLLYRWAGESFTTDETASYELRAIFQLLLELDEEAHDAIFRAALRRQDFPADAARKYPTTQE